MCHESGAFYAPAQHRTRVAGVLQLEFDVERLEGYGLDSELEQIYDLARPPVALVPQNVAAGPIVVSFSVFPGLHVRFGRWHIEGFPQCGCDACDETAESEAKRLTSRTGDLTAGRFREGIRIDENGGAWKEHWFAGSGGKSQLDPVRARELIAVGDTTAYQWAPWPRRK